LCLFLAVSYILACWENKIPYGVKAEQDHFTLVKLDSVSNADSVFSHPYRSGAQKVLNWIKENNAELASKEFSIQDRARFY